MFWDGNRWVSEREDPKPRPSQPRRRIREIAATLPIILLIPALLLPFLSAGAASLNPAISVSGNSVAGATITINGTGFPAREWVNMEWDGAPTGVSARTSSGNAFSTSFTIPAAAPGSTHELSATASGKHDKGGASSASVATASISITISFSSPTTTPTPTPSATPVPTPVATPTPTATPVPTPRATPTPTPSTGPGIVSVSATSLTLGSATIIWTLTEPATGQVEYGLTTAYGALSTPENSYTWSTHVQTLVGLTPGRTYHFRVKSRTLSGVWLISGDYTFTTLGISPTPTPTPSATPTPTPAPTATPTPPPASGEPYGTGLSGDTRSNHQVGWTARARLAFRFRASTTSQAVSLKVQQRGGPIYSGGNGGTLRVTIQTDNSGLPSGTVLSSLTFSPGNPSGHWEVWTPLTFASPASLTAGQRYHVVFDNVASDPVNNYISLNVLLAYNDHRQPAMGDDFATLYAEPSTWGRITYETPIFDLGYANGNHDGMGYIGSMPDYYGSISGSTQMVRERLTVTGGNRTISKANIKVKRISGTSPLVIRLERGDGTVIDTVSIPATSIAQGIIPTGGGATDLGGNTWVTATFASSHVLANGQTYHLRLSTASGTQYIAVPLQEGTDKGLASYRFTDGHGQKTTDGSSWSGLYAWEPSDLQFYFE